MDHVDQAITAPTENNTSSNTSVGSRLTRNCSRCRNHGLKVPQKGHGKECKYRYCDCERCKIITDRRSMLARQSAMRKALSHNEDSVALSIDRSSLSSFSQSVMNLEGSYDSNSGDSSFSNHGSIGTQEGNGDIKGIVSSKAASPLNRSPASTSLSQGQTGTDSSAPSSVSSITKPSRTAPKCARCRNHNVIKTLKGHKRYCKYRDCYCQQCQETVDRQKEMAKQTALRRALAQDEERMKIKEMKNRVKNSMKFPVESKHPPVPPRPARSVDSSYDRSSEKAPINNHGSGGVFGGISNIFTISTTRKLPPLHIHAPTLIHMRQLQPDGTLGILMECTMKLLQLFEYPWEMLTLMYTIVKYAGANFEEAATHIIQAHSDIQATFRIWNTMRAFQDACTLCYPLNTPTGSIFDAPTYEGEVPHIGMPPPPDAEHLRAPPHPLNAHIPTDSPPEHRVTYPRLKRD